MADRVPTRDEVAGEEHVLGRVIILNGTSSSGKSTLVAAIQDLAPTPWLALGIDAFLAGLPSRYQRGAWPELFSYDFTDTGEIDRVKAGPLAHRLVHAMHRAVAVTSATGTSILVDHVLLEPRWHDDLLITLGNIPHFFVAVRCPLDVLEQREAKRGDRTLGQARAQLAYVHKYPDYDLEIDTAGMSPTAAACRILSILGPQI